MYGYLSDWWNVSGVREPVDSLLMPTYKRKAETDTPQPEVLGFKKKAIGLCYASLS